MMRCFFVAMGIFLCVLGSQCLIIEKFILKARTPIEASAVDWMDSEPKLGPQRELDPPEWAPWTLMSTGAIVCLYSYTLPKKFGGK